MAEQNPQTEAQKPQIADYLIHHYKNKLAASQEESASLFAQLGVANASKTELEEDNSKLNENLNSLRLVNDKLMKELKTLRNPAEGTEESVTEDAKPVKGKKEE